MLGNATQFRGWFGVAALGVLFLLVVIGMITRSACSTPPPRTSVRLAMNRLRGAYIDLDPGIEPYFLMSAADDMRESNAPTTRSRRAATQVFASSMMVILVVTTALIGLFVGGAHVRDHRAGRLGDRGRHVIARRARRLDAVGYLGYRSVWRSTTPLRPTPPDGERPGATAAR